MEPSKIFSWRRWVSFDFGAEVDAPAGVLLSDQRDEGPAVDVVTFEVDVGELDDLG